MIRQESFEISQSSQGRVFTFGLGLEGELGLGRQSMLSTTPMLVQGLRHVSITRISCGAKHTLAIDAEGALYSWGSNLHGKLGLQHYNDCFEPQRVRYLLNFVARDCGAGDNHSAVIIAPRTSPDQLKVCAFGRGAHGRLGHNSNKSSPFPVLVDLSRPSLSGAHLLQVACGGAHTLLLAEKAVPISLSNPSGKETYVYAWGYGTNGQLGDGKRKDSFLPVKVSFPKSLIVTQVSAGRSWSLAITSSGDLYSVHSYLAD